MTKENKGKEILYGLFLLLSIGHVCDAFFNNFAITGTLMAIMCICFIVGGAYIFYLENDTSKKSSDQVGNRTSLQKTDKKFRIGMIVLLILEVLNIFASYEMKEQVSKGLAIVFLFYMVVGFLYTLYMDRK